MIDFRLTLFSICTNENVIQRFSPRGEARVTFSVRLDRSQISAGWNKLFLGSLPAEKCPHIIIRWKHCAAHSPPLFFFLFFVFSPHTLLFTVFFPLKWIWFIHHARSRASNVSCKQACSKYADTSKQQGSRNISNKMVLVRSITW